MNSSQIKLPNLVLLASVLLTFAFGCNSIKNTAVITHPSNEKAKIELEARIRRQKEKELKLAQSDGSIKRAAELALKIMSENAPKVRLNEYFNAIAYADNTASANSSISKALVMFTSAETPVLIINSKEYDGKVHDRPTTIMAYLNYLKDEKKNNDDIKNLKVNASGKINEVELKKNN